jgi:hypothetical protein
MAVPQAAAAGGQHKAMQLVQSVWPVYLHTQVSCCSLQLDLSKVSGVQVVPPLPASLV